MQPDPLEKLITIGQGLATSAYNLANGWQFLARDKVSLGEQAAQWDAALKVYRAAARKRKRGRTS